MNKTEGYNKYDQSELIYNQNCFLNYSTQKDLNYTFVGKGKTTQECIERAVLFAENAKGWTREIESAAEEVSKMAIEASKKNRFDLTCKNSSDFFPVFARALYHLHGIRVEKVVRLSDPEYMHVTWDKDNGTLNLPFNFIQLCRENEHFTDFNFQIKGSSRTFPCHRMVMACKTTFYEKGVTGPKDDFYEFEEGTLPETVEFLLDYLYEEKKEVPEELPSEMIQQLLKYAKFFGLKQLKRHCNQHLIKRISSNNANEIAGYSFTSKKLEEACEIDIDGTDDTSIQIENDISLKSKSNRNEYVKYDKSNLFCKDPYSTRRDLNEIHMAKSTSNRGACWNAEEFVKNSEVWTSNILSEVKTISKMAVNASKKNQFSLNCRSPYPNSFFHVFARTLYKLEGVRVKNVDDLNCPYKMVITWDKDNMSLNPSSNFIQMCRENKLFTDFDFQIKGSSRTFPCHRMVMACKTSFYEKGLTGSDQSEMHNKNFYEFEEGTLPETVEFLLAYLYDEKKEFKTLSLEVIKQLFEQAEFFGLKQLRRLCIQHLIKEMYKSNITNPLHSKKLASKCENYFIMAIHKGIYNEKEIQKIDQMANLLNFEKLKKETSLAGLSFEKGTSIEKRKKMSSAEEKTILKDD